MTTETMRGLDDAQLRQVIQFAETELKNRAEDHKRSAMEQIRKLAAEARIQVTFRPGRRPRSLKAGSIYANPADPTQRYVVGKGRPPAWFLKLQAAGEIPPMVTK